MARHTCGVVWFIAVTTANAVVGAVGRLAGGGVLAVEGREVRTCALVAGREAGAAGVGGVSPFHTS